MSAHVRREGIWEIRTWDDHSVGERKRLLACPLCDDHEFNGEEPSTHFYKEHGPEDIGLEPLSDDHDGQSSPSSFEEGSA